MNDFGLSNLLGLKYVSSWRDGYVKASFRNVEFFIERASNTGGRKIIEHTFPEKDDSINEDLGRKNKRFSISAYLIGDDYYNQRNDLEDALNEEGPGILIHPYKGELNVRCDDYTIDENTTEGRMCRFDIAFIWESDIALTVIGPGPFDLLAEAKAAFLENALTFMGAIYDVANAPNAILDDLTSITQIGLTIIDSAKSVMQVDNIFKAKLEDFKNNVESIILSPGILATEIKELIDYGSDTTNVNFDSYTSNDQGKEQFTGMKGVTDFEDTNYSKYPSITGDDGKPAKELSKYISRCGLGSRAGLIATMTIDNAEEADEIAIELDTLLRKVEEDDIISDDFFAATRDLRVAIRNIIVERKLSLSELIEIERSYFQPGLEMAYDLYIDPTRDLEIARLNKILHPGFIPGSKLIKVEQD